MEKILSTGEFSIDLSRVKAIKLESNGILGEHCILVVEYDSRTEYSKNPFSGEIEKNIISDQVRYEYPNYEVAMQIKHEVSQFWDEFKNAVE